MRKLLLIALLALAGCATPNIYRDPASGKVDQCNSSSFQILVALAQVRECSAAYERMGWQKQ